MTETQSPSVVPVSTPTRVGPERLGELVELSADLLATVAPDGQFTWRNENWLRTLGSNEHERRGHGLIDLAHPDDAAATTDEVRRLTAGEDRVEFENRCRASDGTYRVLAWRMSRADGFMLVAATDITERRLADQECRRLQECFERRASELEMAEQELAALNYSVSHDLRAPLRAIDGFTAVVARRYADRLDDSGRELLDRVRSGVAKMNGLIDAMLSLSRLSRREMRRGRVDLSQVAREIAAELCDRDPQRSVEFVIADGLSTIGDRELLRVVLENLLGNAWKFTSFTDQARIDFGGEHVNRGQGFVVSDNGAGFEMAYADRLFVPFSRLHHDDEFPGAGAGLATVQRIVRRHGGSIRGEGRPGEGAVFRFDLACAAEEQP